MIDGAVELPLMIEMFEALKQVSLFCLLMFSQRVLSTKAQGRRKANMPKTSADIRVIYDPLYPSKYFPETFTAHSSLERAPSPEVSSSEDLSRKSQDQTRANRTRTSAERFSLHLHQHAQLREGHDR